MNERAKDSAHFSNHGNAMVSSFLGKPSVSMSTSCSAVQLLPRSYTWQNTDTPISRSDAPIHRSRPTEGGSVRRQYADMPTHRRRVIPGAIGAGPWQYTYASVAEGDRCIGEFCGAGWRRGGDWRLGIFGDAMGASAFFWMGQWHIGVSSQRPIRKRGRGRRGRRRRGGWQAIGVSAYVDFRPLLHARCSAVGHTNTIDHKLNN